MQCPKSMLYSMFFMLFLVASCSPVSEKRVPDVLLRASEILWVSPDSASRMLQLVSPDTLSPYSRACYQLTREHARLKIEGVASVDTLSEVLAFFLDHHAKRYAGEAAYVLAAASEHRGDNYSAVRYLKQAETLLFSSTSHDTVPPVLLGMVSYKLGMNFESDWLYKEAHQCYRRALPYFYEADYHLYIACALRDIARTLKAGSAEEGIPDSGLQQMRDSLFQEALAEASLVHDTVFYLDILDYATSLGTERDTAALLSISRYMTLHLHQPRYAGELADYYISRSYNDSARFCLRLFAADTIQQTWSRDRWHYLNSRLMLSEGKARSAYSILDDLYQNRQRALVRDGQARTFAIARQYDVLREQDKNLRLQLNQQRLYIILAVLIGALAVGVLLTMLYRQRNRRRQAEQQAQIASLNAELYARREGLRRLLTERVRLTGRMQMSELMNGHNKDELPEWAQQFIEQNIIISAEQWDAFLDEFNKASSDILTRLKEEHKPLTKVDLLIIALILTGLSIQDICVLLGQTKRTVWSRRLRIKTHLGLTEADNLDLWLQQQLAGNIR